MFSIDKLKEVFITKFLQCRHKRTTFPQTPKTFRQAPKIRYAEVSCLDCGKKMIYDWEKMEICQSKLN